MRKEKSYGRDTTIQKTAGTEDTPCRNDDLQKVHKRITIEGRMNYGT